MATFCNHRDAETNTVIHIGIARRSPLLGLFAVIYTGACSLSTPTTSTSPNAPTPIPALWVSGCDVVAKPHTCALSIGDSLCVWSPARPSGGPFVLYPTLDGMPLAFTTTQVAQGYRLCAKIPIVPGIFHLRSPTNITAWLTRSLVPKPDCPAVAHATHTREQNHETLVQTLLTQQPNAPQVCQMLAHGLVARTALARNDIPHTIQHFFSALIHAATVGALSVYLNDSTALAYVLTHRKQDFSAARTILAQAALLSGADPTGSVRVTYQTGLLAQKTGDFRTALTRLQEAAIGAQKLGLGPLGVHCAQLLAELLVLLGRSEEAQQWFHQAETQVQTLGACEQARFNTNVGWSAWMSRETDPQAIPDPSVFFARALAAHQTTCPGAPALANAWVNMALGAWQRDVGTDIARSSAYSALLSARQTGALSGETLAWAQWLEGELLASSGDFLAAVSIFETLLADITTGSDLLYKTWVSLARAQQARGDLVAADAAWESAMAELRAGARRIPLGEGRVGFLSRGLETVVGRVILAISEHRLADALKVIHQSYQDTWNEVVTSARLGALSPQQRAVLEQRLVDYRTLRDREAQLRADLAGAAVDTMPKIQADIVNTHAEATVLLDAALSSLDPNLTKVTPAPPDGDEVVLTLVPLSPGYLVFAQSPQRLTAWTVDVDLAGLDRAETVLQPLDVTANTTRLRVLAMGEAFRLPIQTLPWLGGVVLERFDVVWSLGLGAADTDTDMRDTTPRVAVFGDPRGDLRHARGEAKAFADAVSADGISVTTLFGEQATVQALADTLDSASFLYLAGHGESGGRDGLGASLWLAANQQYYAGEILGQHRVPRIVVLSSCEGSADMGERGFVPPLGMAQMFVKAGAQRVVASPVKIHDRCAAIWADHFLRHRPWDGVKSLDNAYRLAALALRAQAPQCDWAAFRLLSR